MTEINRAHEMVYEEDRADYWCYDCGRAFGSPDDHDAFVVMGGSSSNSAEQEARDILDRLGFPNAQNLTAGDVVELANLVRTTREIASAPVFIHDDLRVLKMALYRYGFCPSTESCDGCDRCDADWARFVSIASRIAALLPPES